MEYTSAESSPWGELKLISGSANMILAGKIAEILDVQLTDPRLRRFPDGEINVKIEDSMRGHDVFVIQPTSPPVNDHYMELFIILDALRRASAGRVTAVIPYFGYARKERKTQPREPISAKLMANFITLAGADRLLLFDLHAEAIEGFFDVPTDHLSPHRIFSEHLKTLGLKQITIVAPDAGGGRRAEAVANDLGAPIAFGYKRRPDEQSVEVIAISGDVKGRDCVVVEDIITTGSTVSQLATALRQQGANRVLIGGHANRHAGARRWTHVGRTRAGAPHGDHGRRGTRALMARRAVRSPSEPRRRALSGLFGQRDRAAGRRPRRHCDRRHFPRSGPGRTLEHAAAVD